MGEQTPNPGSPEAIKAGCLCPVVDNAHGKGWMGSGEFWMSEDCPLHGTPKHEQDDQVE
mgnify:CR=1 FL=1